MRRVNPASVKVKAPSRGLVTRWPGEIADQLGTGVDKFSLPGMANRVATFASNVRYEDGVTKNAPGYSRVQGADNIVAHWPLNEATGTRFDTTQNHLDLTEIPVVDQVAGQVDFAAHFPGAAITRSSLFISDYVPGSLNNPDSGQGHTPEWDGSFKWFASNDTSNPFQDVYYGTSQSFHDNIITMGRVCLITIAFDQEAGGWRLMLGNDSSGSTDMIWEGFKAGADAPTGVYTNSGNPANPNPTTPATYTVATIEDAITQLEGFQFCAS